MSMSILILVTAASAACAAYSVLCFVKAWCTWREERRAAKDYNHNENPDTWK